jgi:predicted component of type VI protein secretion system
MFTIVVHDRDTGTERRHAFDRDEVTIGRVEGNDLVLAAPSVSRRHARIDRRDGLFFISDLHTANGTWINHVHLTSAAPLTTDTRVVIANYLLWIEPAQQRPRDAEPAPHEPNSTAIHQPASHTPLGDRALHWCVQWTDARGPQRFASSAPRALIGSDPSCELRVEGVDPQCARIEAREGLLFVVPVDARRELRLSGRPVLVPMLWHIGDGLEAPVLEAPHGAALVRLVRVAL